MDKLPKRNSKLESLVNLFRLIITKDPAAFSEITKRFHTNPSLLYTALQFSCGSIYDAMDTGCTCAFNHEQFSYISGEKGKKINKAIFENILESVIRGKCKHHANIPEGDEETSGPLPTSVRLVHAAAVVGYIPVLEILLELPYHNPQLTEYVRTSPLHLAILFKQRQSIQTILKSKRHKLDYCSSFIYLCKDEDNPNRIHSSHFSVIQLCLWMGDHSTAELIIQSAQLQPSWAMDAFASESEDELKLLLPYMGETFLDTLSDDIIVRILPYIATRGIIKIMTRLLNRLEDKELTNKRFNISLSLLATVYNQSEMLELILTQKADNGKVEVFKYTLLDISNCIGHTECSEILKKHGIQTSPESKQVSPFAVILEIGVNLPFREKTTDLLIRKVFRNNLSDNTVGNETLILYSLRHKSGLGARALLEISHDIEVKGLDGLTPLGLAMKHTTNPTSILDIMYLNPDLTHFEAESTSTEEDLQLFDRSAVKNISMLALAIERDLKNYSIQKWALCYSGFAVYEGSISVLLLDCGYDIRGDELVLSSYSKLLRKEARSAIENEIRARILNKITTELFYPKPLTLRCRDVLRRTFTGHSLHTFIGTENVPRAIKDFILMESRLKRSTDINLESCHYFNRPMQDMTFWYEDVSW